MTTTNKTLSNTTSVDVFITSAGAVRRSNVTTSAAIGREITPNSRAIALRELTLTPQEATALVQMLDDPTLPAQRGQPVPPGDLSLFVTPPANQ